MKMTIELDGDALKGTFLETFRKMSTEKKEELVADLMKGWLKDSLAKESDYRWNTTVRPVTDALGTICQEMKTMMIERTKTDTDLQKVIDAGVEVIQDHLPELAQKAVQSWFASHLSHAMQELSNTGHAVCKLADVQDEIRMKLGM